jgi:hypothetical protein
MGFAHAKAPKIYLNSDEQFAGPDGTQNFGVVVTGKDIGLRHGRVFLAHGLGPVRQPFLGDLLGQKWNRRPWLPCPDGWFRGHPVGDRQIDHIGPRPAQALGAGLLPPPVPFFGEMTRRESSAWLARGSLIGGA